MDVYVLEEFCGPFDDVHCTNFVGVYSSKDAAMKGRDEHHKDLKEAGRLLCIDGYQLTKMEVKDEGIQWMYMTEEV